MGRKVGYARCSSDTQNIRAQIDRLLAAGCDIVFKDDGVSGKLESRPDWDRCLAYLRKDSGDTLCCTKLDRIGRSVAHLTQLAARLEKEHIGLVCLDQGIDTTSAMGKLFYTILGAFAEFEWNLISERTKDGLAAPTGRGRNGGRHPKLQPHQIEDARQSIDGGAAVTTVARELKVSRQTLYRSLSRAA